MGWSKNVSYWQTVQMSSVQLVPSCLSVGSSKSSTGAASTLVVCSSEAGVGSVGMVGDGLVLELGVTDGERRESNNPSAYASVASDSRPRMGASGNRVDGHSLHQGEAFAPCQLAFLIFGSVSSIAHVGWTGSVHAKEKIDMGGHLLSS